MFEDEVVAWVNAVDAAKSNDSAIHAPVVPTLEEQTLKSMPVTTSGEV
jgi:hypothetical protein